MDTTAHALVTAHMIYSRANETSSTSANTASRPPVYKAIGISLAISSGCFIGVSFVLKKIGLLKANEKYDEAAGEGYGYLKNAFWWSGMTLMIIGEICNFVAYAFVDAILVTPMGALSVVITTILSAIFLKERLSLIGKVGCFLCIIGSVVIVLNAPAESSAATIQEMQKFVIAPGFLSYAGVIIASCAFIALWAGPRYGKKSMLVYLSICSLIGGLSVVATQGLGAAIVTQIGGTPQFNQWFLYVLLVFVVTTLVTEIIYLNKALNLFNAALVTPTYYVFFTSSTIVTSAILFRGFKGTAASIVTVVLGFLTICSGVILLQLSKSAKDVPDSAVFAGDLDQVRTIAEQEQPESEPKADAIRGTAAIVRRFSQARQKMEMQEAKRLHEEKQQDLEPIGENEQIEWDGLRRRRTTIGSMSQRSRGSSNLPPFEGIGSPRTPQVNTSRVNTPRVHPPLGMSRFPDPEEDDDEESRPSTGGLGSSILGTIRGRARSMRQSRAPSNAPDIQSPMHPVPLTEISIPAYNGDQDGSTGAYYSHEAESRSHTFGLPSGLQNRKTEYEEIQIVQVREEVPASTPKDPHHHLIPPAANSPSKTSSEKALLHLSPMNHPPPHAPLIIRKGLGIRTGSSHSVTKGATEEERLGLVKGDTNTSKSYLPPYVDEGEDEDDNYYPEDKASPDRDLLAREKGENESGGKDKESIYYEEQRRKWDDNSRSRGPPPPFDDHSSQKSEPGAFI
ncbi:hypothetical protein B7494_g1729 [Chlorociboria aeruginascens]|nr:hypothetical protein B7494_g1729 [Chlorociboria aeruginascens]